MSTGTDKRKSVPVAGLAAEALEPAGHVGDARRRDDVRQPRNALTRLLKLRNVPVRDVQDIKRP